MSRSFCYAANLINNNREKVINEMTKSKKYEDMSPSDFIYDLSMTPEKVDLLGKETEVFSL